MQTINDFKNFFYNKDISYQVERINDEQIFITDRFKVKVNQKTITFITTKELYSLPNNKDSVKVVIGLIEDSYRG